MRREGSWFGGLHKHEMGKHRKKGKWRPRGFGKVQSFRLAFYVRELAGAVSGSMGSALEDEDAE